jgi:CDP-6-deoxy-D-xylo-4-hexulose-3-dehydrase
VTVHQPVIVRTEQTMTYQVPLAYNSIGPEEVAAAEQVLRSGFLTQGQKVAELEERLASSHGVQHAILVNSGSSANLIAIEAVVYLSQLRPDLVTTSISPGDEVIIQGLNWPSTIKPMTNHGLTPVFCDVDLESLNASVADVDAVRTDRTRMVVAVPVLGNPTHMDELREYCERHELVLMEDACESLGATTAAGRKVGTLGLASAFSFYFSHHMTTIEGGAILTDDPHVADLCYALRAHGWSRNLRIGDFLELDDARVDPRFCFVLPGYNVRSTEVNAAIGLVQLSKLPAMVEGRRQIAAARIAALDGESGVVIPGKEVAGHSWMTLPLLFEDTGQRDKARDSLECDGVETRPIIVGNMLRHPLAKNLRLSGKQPDLPGCDAVFDRGLMIGLDPTTNAAQEQFVHDALRRAARA